MEVVMDSLWKKGKTVRSLFGENDSICHRHHLQNHPANTQLRLITCLILAHTKWLPSDSSLFILSDFKLERRLLHRLSDGE